MKLRNELYMKADLRRSVQVAVIRGLTAPTWCNVNEGPAQGRTIRSMTVFALEELNSLNTTFYQRVIL
jgi:hypothetical protein